MTMLKLTAIAALLVLASWQWPEAAKLVAKIAAGIIAVAAAGWFVVLVIVAP